MAEELTQTNRLVAIGLIRAVMTEDDPGAGDFTKLLPDNPGDAIQVMVSLASQVAGYIEAAARALGVDPLWLLDEHVRVITKAGQP